MKDIVPLVFLHELPESSDCLVLQEETDYVRILTFQDVMNGIQQFELIESEGSRKFPV